MEDSMVAFDIVPTLITDNHLIEDELLDEIFGPDTGEDVESDPLEDLWHDFNPD